ncbi:MAG TPA: J domain-containing protein [Acidimicrobiales bacterium]
MPTHYEILGVASDADIETIRRAYVALAKANHPDRRQTEDDTRRARADERIRAANAAWHVLRDPQRRADYDRSLRHGSSVGGGSTATAASGPGAPGAPRPRPNVVGARPAPPSGMVVPASQASLWRYVPIAVLLVVLAAVLVVSAYATSGGSGPDSPGVQEAVPVVGDCVLVVMISGARAPVPVGCGTAGSARVSAVVDTPRPCPTGTEPVAVPGGRSTLCVQF